MYKETQNRLIAEPIMTFILPDDFLEKLATLRNDYEKLTKTNLSTDPQPNMFFRAVGYKDVNERHHQISLIEKIQKTLLHPFFDANGKLNLSTEDEVNEYFNGLRVLVAAVLYLKSEINDIYWVRSTDHSALVKLLDHALALSNGNIMDEDTLKCVFDITKEYIVSTTPKGYKLRAASKINQDLEALISDPKWSKLDLFVTQQRSKLGGHPEPYPMTATLMPALATAGYYTGLPIGFILGETFAKSTLMLPARAALTTALGTVLLIASGGGTTISIGLVLVAPPYAGYLLETFMGVSFAAVLGNAMSLLGKGAGWSVGMSLDMTYKLACYALTSLYSKDSQLVSPISGFNLVNGDYYLNGQQIKAIETSPSQSNLAQMKTIKFQPTDEGIIITVGDDGADQALIPYNSKLLTEEQQLLRKKFETEMTAKGFLPTAEQTFNAEENDLKVGESTLSCA